MIDTKEINISNKKIIPVILSGGSGSRLWPLSRECHPKQYLYLDQNKYSLLQNTILRLFGINNLEDPVIICNEEHRFIVAEQLRELDIKPKSIILEPIGKNTAPAISLAALSILKRNYDPFLLILSADHHIKDAQGFQETIQKGLYFAENENLVTFGIIPTSPETGYGYIEANKELNDNNFASSIKRFIEKPDKETAEKFLRNKCFSWNSGIFLFKASTIIRELKKYHPQILDICKKSIIEKDEVFNFQRIKKSVFINCPSIPIDVAIMEKTKRGIVLSLDVGWSDIGN